MNYPVRNRDQHLANDGEPKRILALDGGGLRGIFSLGILARMESILRRRHGNDPDFRLAHYFDLIAGTSTGAIIAATLAKGWSVEQIRQKYEALGHKVFEKSWLRQGLLRAKYDKDKLTAELQAVYGADTTLGSDALQTGLLVVTKRLDSGSPWPLSNNPKGQYFEDGEDGAIGNKRYPLWKVVRASTAAPTFFDPEEFIISEGSTGQPVKGQFVDGGVSPFNNPALQAFMYATLTGYRIGWPKGGDKILLVSVGTGNADPTVAHDWKAAAHGIAALKALMEDTAALQETLLQWLSDKHANSRWLDGEIGDLGSDLLAAEPQLSYRRYNLDLTEAAIEQLAPDLANDKRIASLSEMDAPENMDLLHQLGTRTAAERMQTADFPGTFDLSNST